MKKQHCTRFLCALLSALLLVFPLAGCANQAKKEPRVTCRQSIVPAMQSETLLEFEAQGIRFDPKMTSEIVQSFKNLRMIMENLAIVNSAHEGAGFLMNIGIYLVEVFPYAFIRQEAKEIRITDFDIFNISCFVYYRYIFKITVDLHRSASYRNPVCTSEAALICQAGLQFQMYCRVSC